MSTELARRGFLKAATHGAAAATAFSWSRVMGANDRIRIGIIGCGSRATALTGFFQQTGEVEIVALCDIYGQRIGSLAAKAPGAEGIHDHRKLLDKKDIDAVVIASSDHWHSPMAIDAMNAGKDVYVEKPLTRLREEGPVVAALARRTQRICQVGAQQRSGLHYVRAKEEYIKPGKLGKITLVRTWWEDNGTGHRVPEGMTSQPADLDWKRYLGPVSWREWNPLQYFNFRNYFDFSGGMLTNVFVHWIDVVHMLMDVDAPVSVAAIGGLYFCKDGRTAPDTLNVALEYPGGWIATYTNVPEVGATREGIEFCGTEAHLRITREQFEVFPNAKGATPIVVKAETDLAADHVKNFLDCCRTRRQPNCDAYAGHRSAQAAHLGNLSYREGRRIRFDPARETILPA